MKFKDVLKAAAEKVKQKIAEKEVRTDRKWHFGIGVKLLLSFILPVCFVIIIGLVSYQKSSNAIISKYKASSLQAIEMTNEYINQGMENIVKTSMQYSINSDIIHYIDNDFEAGSEKMTAINTINGMISQEKSWNSLISGVHVLSEGNTLSTTGNIAPNLFSKLSAIPTDSPDMNKDAKENISDESNSEQVTAAPTEAAASASADEKTGDLTPTPTPVPQGTLNASIFEDYWSSKESALDEALALDNSNYAIRFIKGIPAHKGAVLMDIGTSSIQKILQRLDFGKGSIISFVTKDGAEIARSEKEASKELIFVHSKFYQTSTASPDISGTFSTKYKNKNYLYLFSKIGKSGAMICVLIPESKILEQVNSIKHLMYFLVILASAVAILIGTLISKDIQGIIKYIISELKEVAAGNLKVQFATKRRDEFFILTNGLNDTVTHMRGLITDVQKQSEAVNASSSEVRKASEVFAEASKEIMLSVNEIQQGIDQQAQDSQSCLELMDHLSNKIEVVSGKTNEIQIIARKTKSSIEQGLLSVEDLNDKTNSTANITDSIVNKIQILEQMSRSVGTITATISSIADSTNLLSLNASIEASRAGAAGAGFKVVAEEIRKLADQSISSVHMIDKLINDMRKQTAEAVAIANQAEKIIKDQELSFQHTKGSFNEINQQAESLVDNVGLILSSIQTIEEARQATLSAIESISAVSQQTAAASMSVNQTIGHQTEAVDVLETLSKELEENSMLLHRVIEQFSI